MTKQEQQTAENVFEKDMPSDVSDQNIAAQPSKYLRVKLSEKLPVNRTKVPKQRLNNGPATYPYLASVKPGIAYFISYLGSSG